MLYFYSRFIMHHISIPININDNIGSIVLITVLIGSQWYYRYFICMNIIRHYNSHMTITELMTHIQTECITVNILTIQIAFIIAKFYPNQ